MALFGKKEGPKPAVKPVANTKKVIGRTIISGVPVCSFRNYVDSAEYNPDYNFKPYFKSFATLCYIPPNLHEIIANDPTKYPIYVNNHFEKGLKLKPCSYSIHLIREFEKKENTKEKGKLYFGRNIVDKSQDSENETIRNDIGFYDEAEKYKKDFVKKFGIDPFGINKFRHKNFEVENAFNYPCLDDKGEVVSHGWGDISRSQFELCAFDDSIKIADGRDCGIVQMPSGNVTAIVDTDGNLKILKHEGKVNLEKIVEFAANEFGEFSPSIVRFGHEFANISGEKGYNFITLVTQNPLIIQETSLTEEEFKTFKNERYNEFEKEVLAFYNRQRKKNCQPEIKSLTDEHKKKLKEGLHLSQYIRERYNLTDMNKSNKPLNVIELAEKYGLKEEYAFSR